ncbi:hypothetical protein ACKC9G_12925 [Pokkaliibacter sp. CJK22405]|uniref:hypothetical protein n=1 Tax=Pokkaliibacter sp. CJK22405 TaxID=3384615 RepID=UPI00398533D4
MNLGKGLLRINVVVLSIFYCSLANASDDCTFDETAYTAFTEKYVSTHDLITSYDKNTGAFTRQLPDQTVQVTGGGCVDIGTSIIVIFKYPLSKSHLPDLIHEYLSLYGNWLIDESLLADANTQYRWSVDGPVFEYNLGESGYYVSAEINDKVLRISAYMN